MTKPIIKPTVLEDIEGLVAVLDGTGLFPGALLPDMLAPYLEKQTDALWLTCHVENEAVGFCYVVPEALADGTWNMLALAVRPDLQGKTLGSALVRAAEKTLQEDGRRLLVVDTSGTDEFSQTRKFYTQNGYVEEARIRDFWASGDDKVIFRKAL